MTKKKKVLITGGNGYIGKHLINALSSDIEPIILSRSIEKKSLYQIRQSDYSISSLISQLKDIDSVIHLAATRLQTQTQEYLGISNTILDNNLFKACLERKISNIVFTSTVAVYGHNYKEPRLEQSKTQPENDYSLGKKLSEDLASFYNQKGLRIKSLRVAQVLGSGENQKNMVTIFLKQASNNESITLNVKGNIQREYIYINDLCTGIIKALGQPEMSGIYNIGGNIISNPENMAQTINRVFNNEAQILYKEPLQSKNEYSVMDSSLFSKNFAWRPQYNLEKAIIDIKKSLN